MADTASIKLRFQSPYQAGVKVWSTTFHLTGGAWQDQAHFDTFSNALKVDWLNVTPTDTTFLDTTAYDPGSALPRFTHSYNAAGLQALDGPAYAPLEACYLLRFSTDQRSTKNHPIYLFNYIHHAMVNASGTPDIPRASMKSALQTRCNLLVAGYSDGTLTRKRAGPRGAVAQSGVCETYLTHRDFPR